MVLILIPMQLPLFLSGGPKLPPSVRRSPTPAGEHVGITIGATRYSSEDTAILVAYTCAIMEYSYHCGPLQTALNKLSDLKKEKEETDRLQKEKDELVCQLSYSIFIIYCD